MKKVLGTLAVLAILTLSASATNYKIVGGTVWDDSGAPIAGATVELLVSDIERGPVKLATQTTTDELGRYSFASVDAAGISFWASKAGLVSRSQTNTTKSHKDGVLVIDITIHASKK